MFHRILFATDFSPHAKIAAKLARQLAKGEGKQVWALTVIDPEAEPLTLADEPPGISPDAWEAEIEREETAVHQAEARQLAQTASELESAGAAVSQLLREGDPAKEIVAAAGEVNADLIIIGSHSRRNVWDVLMGSTAERVAKTAPCPVLIVSHRPPQPCDNQKRILFATDFSHHAQVAEKLALTLAKEDGRRLWALTVIEPGEELPMPPGYTVTLPDQQIEELRRELREVVEQKVNGRLDSWLAEAQNMGIEVTKLVRHGRAAEQIVAAAKEINANCIVIGSHSRRHLWEALLGNTAAKVAKTAPCPVLVVSHLPEHVKKQRKINP